MWDGVLRRLPGGGVVVRGVWVASVGMAVLWFWGAGDLSAGLQWGLWHRVGQLVLWGGLGGLVYFGILLVLGVRLRELMGRAH